MRFTLTDSSGISGGGGGKIGFWGLCTQYFVAAISMKFQFKTAFYLYKAYSLMSHSHYTVSYTMQKTYPVMSHCL